MLAAPMARLQQRKQAAVTTGQPKQSGIPCAMVLRLYVVSPGTGSIVPVAGPTPQRHHRLDLSTGRPGPHDFTSASMLFVGASKSRCNPTRPPHPASRIVTTARTPLSSRQDGHSHTWFLEKRNRKISSTGGALPFGIEISREMNVYAQAVCRVSADAVRRDRAILVR
ncbi:hypothetical protein [Bradyrhizobium sp. SZCCHNPS2010]|uniref:hypothetical protein n=1 Tax=Bradyrhizobium sp. SZCCHNPS2010 TaxID=3057333 RepID=UPI002916A79F|nr:hypothetical protein [Bradyrhizobium sp. SZCCHNPS2010]